MENEFNIQEIDYIIVLDENLLSKADLLSIQEFDDFDSLIKGGMGLDIWIKKDDK